MAQSETIGKLAEALAAAQGSMSAVKNLKNVTVEMRSGGKYAYSYADLATIWEASREALAANGLAVTQLPTISDSGDSVLRTVLFHTSGEWVASELKVAINPNDPQATGAALTYARRYTLSAIVGVSVEDEDDDGQAAKKEPTRPRREGKPPSNTGRAPSEASTPPSESPGGMKTAPELYTRAVQEKGYNNKDEVLAALGCEKVTDIIRLHESYDQAWGKLPVKGETP